MDDQNSSWKTGSIERYGKLKSDQAKAVRHPG